MGKNGYWILVFYPSQICFDSDISSSKQTVVCFNWKTVIYISVSGKCRTQYMMPMEKSATFTGACVNDIIPNGYLARLLTKRKKEVWLESNININKHNT
jgi:hypothetical protein